MLRNVQRNPSIGKINKKLKPRSRYVLKLFFVLFILTARMYNIALILIYKHDSTHAHANICL